MEKKWTPGPWHIRGSDILAGNFVVGMVNPTGDYPKETHDANALLISLSPEMAELLMELFNDFYIGYIANPSVRADHFRAKRLEQLERIAAILNKLEGK